MKVGQLEPWTPASKWVAMGEEAGAKLGPDQACCAGHQQEIACLSTWKPWESLSYTFKGCFVERVRSISNLSMYSLALIPSSCQAGWP
jgi:hypothetical protein